jgi:hypothetical protein
MLALQLEQRQRQRESVTQRRLAALERIQKHHQAILARRGGHPLEIEASSLIEAVRDERDDELFATDKRLANSARQLGLAWVYWVGDAFLDPA